jgi:hypothetical protein
MIAAIDRLCGENPVAREPAALALAGRFTPEVTLGSLAAALGA